MKVEEVCIGVQPESSYQLECLLGIVQKKNIKLTVLESGMKLQISNNSYIDVLWPTKKEFINENALNNNSLVFKFMYREIDILFTGDIEKNAEEKIIEMYKDKIKCDILKVAHHGSKSSTINKFLIYANPKIALIGVGKNNKFGHPNDIVLDNLNCFRSKNL